VRINGVMVAPVMVPFINALREVAQKIGATFRLTSGYRTPAEQEELRRRYEAGDKSIIYPPAQHSYHLQGLAVDIESNRLDALGDAAERLGMRWGGRYGDPVHFDLGRSSI